MTGRGVVNPGNKRITRNAMPGRNQRSPKTPFSPRSGDRQGAGNTKVLDSDIQKVLDRLDNIEVSLQTKIDESILSQEFTAKQLSDKITRVEDANHKAH